MPPRNSASDRRANSAAATARQSTLVAAVVDSVVLALGLDTLDIDRFMDLHEDLSRAVATAMIGTRASGATACSSDD
jgi:hypothetical protein